MGRGKDSGIAITQSMALTPSLYITPASSENFATQALVQNSTKHTLENILKQFAAYKVGVKGVQSIDGFLNTSRHALVNLGFDVRQFPADMVREEEFYLVIVMSITMFFLFFIRAAWFSGQIGELGTMFLTGEKGNFNMTLKSSIRGVAIKYLLIIIIRVS